MSVTAGKRYIIVVDEIKFLEILGNEDYSVVNDPYAAELFLTREEALIFRAKHSPMDPTGNKFLWNIGSVELIIDPNVSSNKKDRQSEGDAEDDLPPVG